jgi:hypothetical protein
MAIEIPPPNLTLGTHVRVRLSERNRTPHTGTIQRVVWHYELQRHCYFMVDDRGRKVSKRYFDDDFEVVS